MIISKVNRTSAEKIFINVHNVEATSITTGQGAIFCCAPYGVNSIDGVSVVRVPASGNAAMLNFAGIAAQDIVADGYGLVQAYGYCNSIMMSHEASNLTVGAGLIAQTILQPGGLAGTFTSLTPQDALSVCAIGQAGKYVVLWDTCNISLSAHAAQGVFSKGFVRAL